MKQSNTYFAINRGIISVVLATGRRSQMLAKCLKALNRQTLEKQFFEVIVVSAGGNHRTEKSISRLFPGVRYYSIGERKGLAAARNYGWLSAKGKLIAFTDDDCLPDKNWLKNIYQNYHNETEIAFSGRVHVPLPAVPTDFQLNTARRAEATFTTANCICTKAALLKVGGFDERFRMLWREDRDLEFKLLSEQIMIKTLQDALVVRPVKKASWGISIMEQKNGMFNALLYKKFPFLYRQKADEASPWYYYLMITLFFGMIYGFLTANSPILEITLTGYSGLFLCLTFYRLKKTSRKLNHIAEMLVTSMIIPFVSVYWRCYGAFKYKVLFM